MTAYPGWSAYWQEGGTFVKYAPQEKDACYPDFGSVFETFCCDFMIEMEALGPLRIMEPGQEVTLVEHWGFFKDLSRPDTDEAYNESLLPAVQSWLQTLS